MATPNHSFESRQGSPENSRTLGPPINHIPVELLAKIFSWCLHSYSNTVRNTRLLPKSAAHSRVRLSDSTDPNTLSQTCGYWRNVALATPALWSSITMNKPEKRDLVTIKLWLHRSGSYPLHLSFIEKPPRSEPVPKDTTATQTLFDILITEVHRWKDIDFHFAHIVEPALLKLPVGVLLLLESARIHSRPNDLLRRAQLWGIIHASPSFQKAGWDGIYLERMVEKVPWHKLTTICLMIFTLSDQLWQALCSCCGLVTLDLDFWETKLSDTPYSTGIPFILPLLRELTLRSEKEPDQFFDRLTLPRLDSLHLRKTIGSTAHSDRSSLENLLDRSQCQLRKFSYSCFEKDGEEAYILDLLTSSHLSNLNELCVKSHLTDKHILSLTHSMIDGDDNTLPQLQTLIIGACTTSPGVLAGMLASRRSKPVGAPRLLELQLTSPIKYQMDIDQLKILGVNGLIIFKEGL